MPTRLKLKALESELQQLEGFSQRDVRLEQYETPPHIAAVALHTIQSEYEELEGQIVLDAGCGPGVLGAGAALLGAAYVTCVDIDAAALDVLSENVDALQLSCIDAVTCDLLGPSVHRWENWFDTVLMNPPFGTKHNAGVDMRFLQMALRVSCGSVYSFHKTSTREHVRRRVRQWGGGVEAAVVAELRYDLPASYAFHKHATRDIAVDLWRLNHS